MSLKNRENILSFASFLAKFGKGHLLQPDILTISLQNREYITIFAIFGQTLGKGRL